MNAKTAKAIRRVLRQAHVDVNQRIYIKRNIHMVRTYGLDADGKKFVLGSTEAHTAYLSPACGRKVYKQLKRAA